MIRLVITLFAVLVLAWELLNVGREKIDIMLYTNDGKDFFPRTYRGTFSLLDETIAGKEGTDLQQSLAAVRDQFKTAVRLDRRTEMRLPADGLATIDAGDIYLYDRLAYSSLHRNSTIPGLVWNLPLSLSEADRQIASISGTLKLIEGKFVESDAQNSSATLEQLQDLYDVPIALHEMADLELRDTEERLLKDGQVIVRNANRSGELFMVQFDNKLVFQFGPIDYPISFDHGYTYFMLPFTLVVVFGGILLWVWPLWRDLQRLRHASKQIGVGQFDTRVRSRATSLIRPVLVGFNQMAARTESMVESQKELTNAVSHELRTPLARMMFDLQMARDSHNKNEQIRHFDNLDYNIKELNTMVDELLTYARQERTDAVLEFESFNAEETNDWLVDQVNRAIRSRENACKVNIVFEPTDISKCSFSISPRLMAHALSNTLQNALRFAQQRIHVELQLADGQWVLSVEDDGVGIPEAGRERVFEPFSRLDESRQRGSGGFGLGLSIVRKIAQWHHGNAHITPTSTGQGTRVEIHWPIHTG